MSLKIILDSDGVCANTTKRILERYNAEYGTCLAMKDIISGNLKKIELPGTDMNKYFSEPGFFRNLEPIEDAQFYIAKLIEEGHDVVIATASPILAIEDKSEWFKEYFPFLPEENFIPILRKDMLYGDIMLDDGLHNIIKSQCDYPVIFSWPWNINPSAKYASLAQTKRVSSWKEFYNFVVWVNTVKNQNLLQAI